MLTAVMAALTFPTTAVLSGKCESKLDKSGVIKAAVSGTLQFQTGQGYFISEKSKEHPGWQNRVWLAVGEHKVLVRQLQDLEGKFVTVSGELEQMPENVQASVPPHGMYLKEIEIAKASDESSLADPAVLSAIPPNHPPIAKAANVYGQVVIQVMIDQEGKVTSTTALTGHELLRRTSENAAKQWIFWPAVDGPKVRQASLTFNFRLMEELKRKSDETVVAFMPPYGIEIRYYPAIVN
jgi:hypothetical protein